MTIAVVGVGLVGGSIGLAARERLGAEVRGIDPRADAALARGAVDSVHDDLAEALDGAEAAFVAVPIDRMAATVQAVLDAAGPDCAVTDVGSTKGAVTRACRDARFVGGHPLAGAEVAGVEHARADLFQDATWYLTPAADAQGVLFERLHRLLCGLGARPVVVDADAHDRLMAAVSHLPHVLANVLVARAVGALGGERIPATGPSFRDATRVAGAHPELWSAIYAANAGALADELDGTIAALRKVRDGLRAGTDLRAWQEQAATDRAALLSAGLAAGPVRELRALVPNRPGVVAEIARALGHAGINIADLALSPSPANDRGEIVVSVAEARALEAAELVRDLGFTVSAA